MTPLTCHLCFLGNSNVWLGLRITDARYELPISFTKSPNTWKWKTIININDINGVLIFLKLLNVGLICTWGQEPCTLLTYTMLRWWVDVFSSNKLLVELSEQLNLIMKDHIIKLIYLIQENIYIVEFKFIRYRYKSLWY